MTLTAYRIAHPRFPLYSGVGAALTGSRWNPRGYEAIYAAGSYAGALLEQLVRLRLGRVPRGFGALVITVPDDVRVEVVDPTTLPRWAEPGLAASQSFGRTWLDERRTAVLRVPSVIAPAFEWNLVINPAHADAARVRHGDPMPVVWDERLFAPGATAR